MATNSVLCECVEMRIIVRQYCALQLCGDLFIEFFHSYLLHFLSSTFLVIAVRPLLSLLAYMIVSHVCELSQRPSYNQTQQDLEWHMIR